jgi:hypothetical protein
MPMRFQTISDTEMFLPQPGSLIRFKGGVIWCSSNKHGFDYHRKSMVPDDYAYFLVATLEYGLDRYTGLGTDRFSHLYSLSVDGYCFGPESATPPPLRLLVIVVYEQKICVIETHSDFIELLPGSL